MVLNKLFYRFDKAMQRRGVSERGRADQHYLFRMIAKDLDLEHAGRKEIEQYIDDLNDNKVTRKDGKPYAGRSKGDMKRFLKSFYKWYKGGDIEFPDEVKWIVTRTPKHEEPDEKDTLSLDQVVDVSTVFNKQVYKMATLITFDCGFRLAELMSVRREDIKWEVYDDAGNECWWIRCRQSKTKTRNVPIPLFSEEITNWLNTAEMRMLKNNDRLFKGIGWRSYAKRLKSIAKEKFGKDITVHCMRHSSASYYRPKLTDLEMCARYGWSLGSHMPHLYSHVDLNQHTKIVARVVHSDQVSKLKAEWENDKKEIANKLAESNKKQEETMRLFVDLIDSSNLKKGEAFQRLKEHLSIQ